MKVRNVLPSDVDECFEVERSGFPEEEAASRESIQKRIETFPEGFFVAELDGRIIGIINSASTNKDDISDEQLKQMIGHEPDGKNMVVFSLTVVPEFQKRGIAQQLMMHFIEGSKRLGKQHILLMCKQNLIAYYERLGFVHIGLSASMHGGAEWHEMRYTLE